LKAWAALEPRLRGYEHYFDALDRRAPNVRSAEVEEVLSQSLDPLAAAAAIHGVLANAELPLQPARGSDGVTHEVAQGTVNSLLTSPDRELRRTAWESYADAHLAYRNTMAAALSAGLRRDVFLARSRGFGSSLESALSPNHIPMKVFHNTIATFRANLGTWHRYWRVRGRLLGVDRLHGYDTRSSLARSKPVVPYQQAVDWISAGVRHLGDEYVSVLRDGATHERWVDIYPNRGKRMGAYSASVPGTHPFIFMSYGDDLFSMSTLAHELGHSMHSYYTTRTQPFVYARYVIFVAEVASNLHQALVRAHLLATSEDPEFELAVIDEAMSNFYRYFLIMPSLARFELEVHERVEAGDAVTADGMTSLMADLLSEAFGEDVELDRERVGITWAQFHTHLYSRFYSYQYATGIAGAHALAERILAGERGAAQRYLDFLGSGGSLYPLDALRLAGVDLESPEPVEQAFAVMAGYVDRLERLAEK
jgi:oligoendopeptidase F